MIKFKKDLPLQKEGKGVWVTTPRFRSAWLSYESLFRTLGADRELLSLCREEFFEGVAVLMEQLFPKVKAILEEKGEIDFVSFFSSLLSSEGEE